MTKFLRRLLNRQSRTVTLTPHHYIILGPVCRNCFTDIPVPMNMISGTVKSCPKCGRVHRIALESFLGNPRTFRCRDLTPNS